MKPVLTLIVAVLFVVACDQPAENPTAATDIEVGVTAKKVPKVDVCHATGSESNPYVLINISGNALNAHLNHGDALPGTEGLDENCDPAPVVCDVQLTSGLPLTVVSFSPPLFEFTWSTSGTTGAVTYTAQGGVFDQQSGSFTWLDLATLQGTGSGSFSLVFQPCIGATCGNAFRLVATCASGGDPIQLGPASAPPARG